MGPSTVSAWSHRAFGHFSHGILLKTWNSAEDSRSLYRIIEDGIANVFLSRKRFIFCYAEIPWFLNISAGLREPFLYPYRLIEIFYTTLICHVFSTLQLIYNISHISYFLISSLRVTLLSPLYVSLRSFFMISQLFNWSIKLPWELSHLLNTLWAQAFGEPFVSLFKVNWRWTR